jgi:spore cortex biosynthesis protein YabQ
MIVMVACGMTMGLLYDTYRIMKGQTGLRGWLLIICDLLFWASCTFLVFGTLLRVNEGIVRMYLFLGMAVGAVVYFVLLHRLYVRLFLELIRWVKAVYRFVTKLITLLVIKPLIFLYQVLLSTTIVLLLSVWKTLQFIYHIFVKILSPWGRWGRLLSKRIFSTTHRVAAGIVKKVKKVFGKQHKKD